MNLSSHRDGESVELRKRNYEKYYESAASLYSQKQDRLRRCMWGLAGGSNGRPQLSALDDAAVNAATALSLSSPGSRRSVANSSRLPAHLQLGSSYTQKEGGTDDCSEWFMRERADRLLRRQQQEELERMLVDTNMSLGAQQEEEYGEELDEALQRMRDEMRSDTQKVAREWVNWRWTRTLEEYENIAADSQLALTLAEADPSSIPPASPEKQVQLITSPLSLTARSPSSPSSVDIGGARARTSQDGAAAILSLPAHPRSSGSSSAPLRGRRRLVPLPLPASSIPMPDVGEWNPPKPRLRQQAGSRGRRGEGMAKLKHIPHAVGCMKVYAAPAKRAGFVSAMAAMLPPGYEEQRMRREAEKQQAQQQRQKELQRQELERMLASTMSVQEQKQGKYNSKVQPGGPSSPPMAAPMVVVGSPTVTGGSPTPRTDKSAGPKSNQRADEDKDSLLGDEDEECGIMEAQMAVEKAQSAVALCSTPLFCLKALADVAAQADAPGGTLQGGGYSTLLSVVEVLAQHKASPRKPLSAAILVVPEDRTTPRSPLPPNEALSPASEAARTEPVPAAMSPSGVPLPTDPDSPAGIALPSSPPAQSLEGVQGGKPISDTSLSPQESPVVASPQQAGASEDDSGLLPVRDSDLAHFGADGEEGEGDDDYADDGFASHDPSSPGRLASAAAGSEDAEEDGKKKKRKKKKKPLGTDESAAVDDGVNKGSVGKKKRLSKDSAGGEDQGGEEGARETPPEVKKKRKKRRSKGDDDKPGEGEEVEEAEEVEKKKGKKKKRRSKDGPAADEEEEDRGDKKKKVKRKKSKGDMSRKENQTTEEGSAD